ncbi:MAG: PAS domain S-box protein, partial [Myxococcota bacterium]
MTERRRLGLLATTLMGVAALGIGVTSWRLYVSLIEFPKDRRTQLEALVEPEMRAAVELHLRNRASTERVVVDLTDVRAAFAQAVLPGGSSVVLAIVGGILLFLRMSARQSRVEESLVTNQQLLSNVLESMADGLLVLDCDYRYVYWNGAMERLSGVRRRELIGSARRPWEVFPHLLEERVDQLMRAAMQGEVAQREDIPYWLPDGREGFTSELYLPLRGPGGEVTGILGVVREVTERKKAEERIRVSEERFDLAVQGSTDGIWDWNICTNQTFLSPRWHELLEYNHHELPNEFSTIESHIHPEDRDWVLERIRLHLEERVPYDIECRLRTKPGEYRWFRMRGQARWDEEGEPVRMAGSITDVTERRGAEEGLHRTRFSIDKAHDSIFWITSDGRFVDVNGAACRNLGYSRDELLDMKVADLDPDLPESLWSENWERVRERGQVTFESRHKRKDGEIIPVELQATFVEFGDE